MWECFLNLHKALCGFATLSGQDLYYRLIHFHGQWWLFFHVPTGAGTSKSIFSPTRKPLDMSSKLESKVNSLFILPILWGSKYHYRAGKKITSRNILLRRMNTINVALTVSCSVLIFFTVRTKSCHNVNSSLSSCFIFFKKGILLHLFLIAPHLLFPFLLSFEVILDSIMLNYVFRM